MRRSQFHRLAGCEKGNHSQHSEYTCTFYAASKEKEEEFEYSRKNHQRALESMQASIKAEARDKEETLKIKNMASLNTRSTA